MNMLIELYWIISRMIYGRCLHIGKNAKFRLGGMVKNGKNIIIGDDFFIGKDFLLASYFGGEVKIGNRVVAQERVRISAVESVIIGDDVLMGSDILITDNNHGMDACDEKSYMEQKVSAKAVKIGNGCWIGEKCTILSGCTIGERSIIGANSVVTKSIPAYTIAVGIPAKPIKQWNFESKTWEKLLVK